MKHFGFNNYSISKPISIVPIILKQVLNPLVLILLLVSLVNLLSGRIVDGIVIIIIVILNTLIGCYQEIKSKKSISSLNNIKPEFAKVVREKELHQIRVDEIVPGDIVVLEAGDKIPADGRVFDIWDIRVDEAILTGESLPAAKKDSSLNEKTILAEQTNSVFAGTLVTSGNARLLVTTTGFKTEFGKIAESLAEDTQPETSLQIQIQSFTVWIIKIVGIIAILVFSLSLLRQYSFIESLATASALSVGAIPEGLPAIITITLAMGVYKISKRNGIMQDLEAVEALGQINIIATDKTGTLTKNELTVVKCLSNKQEYDFTGIGYNPKGELIDYNPETDTQIQKLLKYGQLCNTAELIYESKSHSGWQIIGDPTEGALIVAGEKIGLEHDLERERLPKIDQIPFSTKTKLMATLHKGKDKNILIVKGAPEVIVNLCRKDSKFKNFKKEIKEQFENYADKGYRVLALASKEIDNKHQKITQDLLDNLILDGQFIMEDAPRENVTESIRLAYTAGIRVIMITGDNELTASAVARQIGLKSPEIHINGEKLESLSDQELIKTLEDCNIFARISPLQKLRIVKILQKNKNIVAVTGDGINDAPSIKSANVGIAMGKKGTAISREAASLVLLDDHFATIVASVEEGRVIYQNIKRIIYYLLSSSAGEVLIICTALIIGLPLPLTAIQILWINLFTDTFNTFPLLYEKGHKSLMNRPPRSSKDYFLDKPIQLRILLMAITMVVITIPFFAYYSKTNVLNAQAFAFAVMTISQLFNVFNAQNMNKSLLKLEWLSNPWPLLTITLSLIMTYFAIESPLLQPIFHTTNLTTSQWLIAFCISFNVILIVEIHKYLRGDKAKI